MLYAINVIPYAVYKFILLCITTSETLDLKFMLIYYLYKTAYLWLGFVEPSPSLPSPTVFDLTCDSGPTGTSRLDGEGLDLLPTEQQGGGDGDDFLY